MDMRAFSTLVPKVSTSVPGCPYPVVVQHIRDAAIRVCERSLAWRYVQPGFVLTPGKAEYEFLRPLDSEVQAVLGATLNSVPLAVSILEPALQNNPDWPVLTTDSAVIAEKGSEPRELSQVGARTFVVLPMPDAARTYTLRMVYALKPSRQATEMSQQVFDEYEDAIMHNALQHLLVMPGAEWTDRELAAYHAKQFLYTVTAARAQANLNTFRGTLTARGPRFA